jgi:hypothetical protein
MRYPIPRQELEAYRASLPQWQAPTEFVATVDELMSRAGGLQFFNDPHIKFVANAWVASKIAIARQATAVRLVPEGERWPDCQLRLGNKVWGYEITGADKEGRRPGEHYKVAAQREAAVELHDWASDLAQVPGAIRRAAELKAAKHYPRSVGLVIYSLIGNYDWSGDYGRNDVEAAMHEATSQAKDAFLEVWVRWGGRLYLLWDHSKRAKLVLT